LTLLRPEEAKVADLVCSDSIQSDKKEVRVGEMTFQRYERQGCTAWQRVV
jgi:hypothetical protein